MEDDVIYVSIDLNGDYSICETPNCCGGTSYTRTDLAQSLADALEVALSAIHGMDNETHKARSMGEAALANYRKGE